MNLPAQPPVDPPVEGTVLAPGAGPVGFTGTAPAPASPASPASGWQESWRGAWQGTWSLPAAPAVPAARRRWVPLALAGAGVALLLGGGAGGYALGHAGADAAPSTSQTGQLVPGGDGFPGSPDGSDRFGGPLGPDDGSAGQTGQQDGTTT